MEKVFKAIPKNSGNILTLPWILFWAFQNTISTLFALMSLLSDVLSVIIRTRVFSTVAM